MSAPRFRSSRQRGVALITALLVAALVAALAMALAARTSLWLNQVQNRQDAAQARLIALGAIDLARLTLRDDARNNQVDHLQEAWAIPIPAINAETGRVGGRIIEMQGFFNLTNLVRNGKVSAQAVKGFERLLALQGLNPILADRLEAHLVQAMKAHHQAGLTFVFPYADLAGLAEIPGFDAATLARLQAVAVVLPEATRLNVNFASPDVLAAVMPALSAGEAASVVSQRAGHYHRTVKAFTEALPEALRSKVDSEACTVQSRYFLAEIDTWFGRVHLRHQALLARSGANMPDVVWVRRRYQ